MTCCHLISRERPTAYANVKNSNEQIIIIIIIISVRRPDLIIINKKKKICKIVDFAVTANHRIKLKECEKRDKYLDLA